MQTAIVVSLCRAVILAFELNISTKYQELGHIHVLSSIKYKFYKEIRERSFNILGKFGR